RRRSDVQLPRMPPLGEAALRPYRDKAAIRRDSRYGRIVCHCERVTEGEVVDAARTPVPARSLDGLRRRTRAQLGRCQGFYCTAEIARIFARETRMTVAEVLADAIA